VVRWVLDPGSGKQWLTNENHRHLMTGTGAYFYIIWGIWLRHCLNGRQEEYDLAWPRIWSLPEVVRTKKSANGGVQHNASKTKI
jgi:dihydroceramidase